MMQSARVPSFVTLIQENVSSISLMLIAQPPLILLFVIKPLSHVENVKKTRNVMITKPAKFYQEDVWNAFRARIARI